MGKKHKGISTLNLALWNKIQIDNEHLYYPIDYLNINGFSQRKSITFFMPLFGWMPMA